MRIFDQEQSTMEDSRTKEINFSQLFGFNNYFTPIEEFPEPFINCCFVNDDKIFVQLFHNHYMTHYHFYWHIRMKKVIGVPSFNE